MSDEQANALSERYRMTGHRLLPGMLARWADDTEPQRVETCITFDVGGNPGWLVDLRDPATLGAALAVFETLVGYPCWFDPDTRSSGDVPDGWVVSAFTGAYPSRGYGCGFTREEAIVAALESVPRP
jgi:hypothetical protein